MQINKRTFLASLLATTAMTACASSGGAGGPAVSSPAFDAANAEVTRLKAIADADPLLKPWTGPYGGVPPWDQARPELIPAALDTGIKLQEAEIQAIANNPAPPTFDTVIVPLQDSGRHFDRAQTIFGVMTDNISNEAIQALEAEWSPKITAAYNAITFNKPLYDKIEAVYQGRAAAGLNPEQTRLVERTRDQLVRAGAGATAEQQARLGQINEQLSTKFAEFGRKLLADEDTAIFITNRRDLAGLPPNIVEQLAAAASERGHAGQWAVVNTRSVVDPFLQFSENRRLREQVWKAFKNRGDNGDANDTNQTIADILALRAERAQILGFPTHAHLRMADTMAGTPERAMELMMRVWPAAVARVHEEVRDMQAIANRGRGPRITIEPWDYNYYAEQVRRDRYDLDQNELRPYFELNNMIAASQWMANQLYGMNFREISGTVPVFEPNMKVWEVTDRDGSFMGLFYGDYFSRAGKRSGAWMNTYRGHETFKGEVKTIASNNNNFVRGNGHDPVLISLDDAQTLFHEFGHAIHYLVSRVNYPGLSNVPRDYVEYPSQVHEHWVLTRPVLDRFAKHYQTNAPMPQALVDRVNNAATFNQGYATVEYLSSALVDMALHNRPTAVTDVDAFERETLASLNMPREIAMRHRLPQFGHLFSSDAYSAGYYSYLWSEVMDADTWEYFQSNGNVFDPTIAAGMRNIILAEGNNSDRAEAYRRFRGRDPDVNALLRVRGFPTT